MAYTKTDRLLPGLRQLSSRQKRGQCFTITEIAEACQCDRKSIGYVETVALKKFIKGLHAASPETLNEIFGDKAVTEVLAKAEAPRSEVSSFSKPGLPMGHVYRAGVRRAC